MRSQINLGHVFGIRIGLHYSWFIIAFLIFTFQQVRERLDLLHRDLELVRDPGVGSALANPCSDAVQLGAQ